MEEYSLNLALWFECCICEGGAHMRRWLKGGEQVQFHQVQRTLLQRDNLQPGNGGE